ncbi:ribose-5-phosphate isomerase RpiA [Oenococcus oeni]|uniref:ribose-5-phosphate isomerase RpiA n=1 Tax=Oenococcus oeni TaxID=1247 RepID=UPI0008F9682E|nr:ribose-5-phosphate isomerase RpiA [Oenococcus oeni]OIM08013.1 ribose 5-phosphate isomerase A [Oenococcus oeni]
MEKNLQNELKKEAAIRAAEFVENDTVVGLGTGSTVKFLVDELGREVREENLSFTGVTTSKRTASQAESLGIKIVSLDSIPRIDLTIDGADQVDNNFNGIKGGGAALLWEKIVATNSKKNIWIVDQSKLVDRIGSFPLPVEVIPFGALHVLNKFEELNLNPVLRLTENGKKVMTDSQNYIIDLHLNQIIDPAKLSNQLINTVGVVEHGLFLNVVDKVVVGKKGQPLILENPDK